MFLFISTPELVLVMVVILIVFGADRVPEIARGIGKGMQQIRNATNEIKHEIQKSAEQHIDTSTIDQVKEDINKIKETLEDAQGRIKRNM